MDTEAVVAGEIVMPTVVLPWQEPVVPVTVYVWAEASVAVTTEALVALRPVAGDHEYVVAPLAVNVVGMPEHTLVLPDTEITGNGETTTLIDAKGLTQPTTVWFTK